MNKCVGSAISLIGIFGYNYIIFVLCKDTLIIHSVIL